MVHFINLKQGIRIILGRVHKISRRRARILRTVKYDIASVRRFVLSLRLS